MYDFREYLLFWFSEWRLPEMMAFFTWPFPRTMPFCLAAFFESLMCSPQRGVVAMIWVLIWVYEFFMRALSICGFDTGFWGYRFDLKNEFLRADLKSMFEIGTEYTMVLQCIILLYHPLSCTEQGDIGMAVFSEKGGCLLCSIIRRILSIVD